MNHDVIWAIVLMYGQEEVTAACIASLLAQDDAPLTVLLVDNKAEDGSGRRLAARFPTIRYLATGANLGYSGGMNRGIECALANGATDVLLLNNDTTLATDCVSRLLAARRAEARVGLVAPTILCFDDPGLVWYGGGRLSRTRAVGMHDGYGEPVGALHDGASAVTFASGCALLIPAPVLRQLGGFAEDFFMYCEDVEFCIRLIDAGYRLYHVPAAVVYHRDRLHAPPRAYEIRFRDRNRRRIARRHLSVASRLRFLLWFYPTRLVHLLRYAATADWARARAIVQGATER